MLIATASTVRRVSSRLCKFAPSTFTCNADRPTQNNCHRHNVPCEYGRLPTTEEDALAPPISPALPPKQPDPLGDTYWELRSFHHFAVQTSITLPGSHLSDVKDCWSLQVPIIALSYKPLWNEILALAALHLMAQGCQDTELLTCRAVSLDEALQTYRPALSKLSPETADAACFTAILLLVDAFAVLQHRELGTYEPPNQWLRIVRGARTVFEDSYSLAKTRSSSIMTIVSSFPGEKTPDIEHGARLLAHLLQPCAGEPLQSGLVTEIYKQTVRHLGSIHVATMSQEEPLALCRRLMSFPCLVPPLFLDLVEQKQPRALVMIGHFFALSIYIKHLWWVGDTPYREVQAIRGQLPVEFQHLMVWPCQLVEEQTRCAGNAT